VLRMAAAAAVMLLVELLLLVELEGTVVHLQWYFPRMAHVERTHEHLRWQCLPKCRALCRPHR